MKRSSITLAALALAAAIPVAAAQQAPPTQQAEAKKETAGDSKAAPSFAGKWSMEAQTPQGAMSLPLEVKIDGANKVTGTLSGPNGPTPITGEVKDGKLGFSINFDAGGQMIEIYFESELKEDKLNGTMYLGDMGNFPFTAVRAKS
ncbi:MAG: hypothetical protein AB7L71_06600 [Vicinamibacterales bacterium]|jgi:glucose/arabinose dehydrogenase